MNETQRKNLLRAADIVDEKIVYMGCYSHDCGTPACILGWYAADPETPFNLDEDGNLLSGDALLISFDSQPVIEHFGLTCVEARELFGLDGCGGAECGSEAATYIRTFVERRDQEVADLQRRIKEHGKG